MVVWAAVVAPAPLFGVPRTIYVDAGCGDDSWTGLSPMCAAPNGPKRTIQAGIDVSLNEDSIRVSPGTYTEMIDFGGRAIHVIAVAGPAFTAIDGEWARHVARFENGEGPGSVLEGFTIARGSAGGLDGGAIVMVDASPVIRRCVFLSSRDAERGGAVAALRGSPTFVDCRFESHAAGVSGGALWLGGAGGAPAITRCVFRDNSAGTIGGAIHISNPAANIAESLFERNSTLDDEAGAGGAIYVSDSGAVTIRRTVFRSNRSAHGGAVATVFSGATVLNGVFRRNTAGVSGGAWHGVGGGGLQIAGALFHENESFMPGGALYVDTQSTALEIAHCTAFANRFTSSAGAGGFLYSVDAEVTILNSIVRNNGVDPIATDSPESVSVHSTNIDGGWAAAGSLNIDVDPLFVGVATGDFRLRADSACAEAGRDNFVPGSLTEDLAGHPRITDLPCLPDGAAAFAGVDRVDMGAYELPPTDCNASGGNDVCEIRSGAGDDCNRNAILDDCEQSPFPAIMVNNQTGVPDSQWLGAPNDVYAGIGARGVRFDLGGGRIVNRPGPDLSVYEVDFGGPEFSFLDVLVSEDGVYYQSLKGSENVLTRVPGDGTHGNDLFGRSYDLNGSGVRAARYILLDGLGAGDAGAQNGFDLDGVAVIQYAAGDCPGDFDGDGDVDPDDMAALPVCLSGPGLAPNPAEPLTPQECLEAFDTDFDEDVDLQDVRIIYLYFDVPPA